MKTRSWRCCRSLPVLYLLLLSALLMVGVPQLGIAQEQAGEGDKPLENSDILAMKRAGIGQSVIVAAIKYAPGERLDSSAEALGSLRSAGVGEVTIAAIGDRVNLRQRPASSAEVSHEDSQAGHARNPSDIKLFFGDKPTEPFRELGRVSSGKFGALGRSRKREAIDDELKKKAAELGGDAVINITEDFASVSGVVIAFQKK